MKCTVFRSSLKNFTYIYLLDGRDFDNLPASLKKVFGEPTLVINLQLTPQRKLANADVHQVMKSLADKGYHLQLPPNEDPTGWLELNPKKEKLL